MQRISEPACWEAGPFRKGTKGPVFGVMYEDPAIELATFRPQSRVFSIASAGCTALALARAGYKVTAVDINPQQTDYAEARAKGERTHNGAIEQFFAKGRMLLPLFGWTRNKLRRFLSMSDPAEQLGFWRAALNSRRWRAATDLLLSNALLRHFYATHLVRSLPPRFGRIIRERLERTWRHHPNATNPYAWRLLLGEAPLTNDSPTPGIRFVCAEAAAFLEGAPPASFEAFTLSNIADGAPREYIARLRRAIAHAAAPGAIVVIRTFGEPHADSPNLAAQDRSILWGAVHAVTAGDLCRVL